MAFGKLAICLRIKCLLLILCCSQFCKVAEAIWLYNPLQGSPGGVHFEFSDGDQSDFINDDFDMLNKPSLARSFSGPGDDTSTLALGADYKVTSTMASPRLSASLSVSGSTPGVFVAANNTYDSSYPPLHFPEKEPEPGVHFISGGYDLVGTIAPGDKVEYEMIAQYSYNGDAFATLFFNQGTIDTPGTFARPFGLRIGPFLNPPPVRLEGEIDLVIVKGGSGTTSITDFSDLDLTTTITPEPSTAALLVIGCVVALVVRRQSASQDRV